MTLFQIVQILKGIAASQPNIRTTTDGSVYDALNNNPAIKYDVFHISQTTHREDENYDFYGFNLFYISRLEDSLEDNRLQIQSIGKEVLSNIIRTLCENFAIDYPDITYFPFTQRFNDLCAGVYCSIQLDVPKELWCADDYVAEVVPGSGIKLQNIGITITENGLRVITPGPGYDGIGEIRIETDVPQSAAVLQDKEVEYTANGSYTIHPDAGYDGLSSVAVDVDVPDNYDEGYDDGKEDGINEQKAKLSTTSVTENGTYTRTDGYSAITVNVPQGQGYEEGYEDGEAAQKAKLVSTAVTENGTYSKEDGYSAITVNVPQGQGYEEGYEDGEAAQKAKLTVTSFTQNNTYTREDGWSAVTVNVPSDYQDGYDDGYEDGYAAGASACSGLFITAITLNVDSAITDSATATTTFAPLTSITDIYYTSSDPSIATIDPATGVITAVSNGSVTICTNDRWSNLKDCKTVAVSKSGPEPILIPYTADTSNVDATGETRCVILDTTGLNTSTIGLVYTGATGLTYVVNNNQVCITFPNNTGLQRDFKVKITASTLNENTAYADITFHQNSPITTNWLAITYISDCSGRTQFKNMHISNGMGSYDKVSDGTKIVNGNITDWSSDTYYTGQTTLYFHLTGTSINAEEFKRVHIGEERVMAIMSVKFPSGLTTIGADAFNGQYHSSGTVSSSGYCGLSSVTIPTTVTSIGDGAFAYCSALTNYNLSSLTGLTQINESVFNSTQMPNVVIPSSVRTIKAGAFNGARTNSITIPASVTAIGDYGISIMTGGTKTITFLGSTPPSFGCCNFARLTDNYTIYVPANAINAYKAVLPEECAEHIQPIP